MKARIKHFFICMMIMLVNTSIAQPKTDSINNVARSPKNKYDIATTYPFSEAVRIELFSYPDRMVWDQQNKKHGTSMDANILRNGKMDVNRKKIKEKKELTSSQQTELLDILYNTSCDEKRPMRCYAPRHALVFYNRDLKAFAFIEICLACRTARTSPGIQVDISCGNRIDELTALFERVGIKYGLKGEDK